MINERRDTTMKITRSTNLIAIAFVCAAGLCKRLIVNAPKTPKNEHLHRLYDESNYSQK